MSKKDALIKAAQFRVRSGGYSNFSFRELATEVGIKSASVHYHFPTKGDLGAELARQYTDDFLASLGDPIAIFESGNNPIETYINQFRLALVRDKKMCLCGLLAAESEALPEKVRYETQRFFKKNIAWLELAFQIRDPYDTIHAKANAMKTVALLEGALLISKTLDDNQVFELAVKSISLS